MMQEIVHVLLQVLASVIGILLGAALADAWQKAVREFRWKRGKKR